MPNTNLEARHYSNYIIQNINMHLRNKKKVQHMNHRKRATVNACSCSFLVDEKFLRQIKRIWEVFLGGAVPPGKERERREARDLNC